MHLALHPAVSTSVPKPRTLGWPEDFKHHVCVCVRARLGCQHHSPDTYRPPSTNADQIRNQCSAFNAHHVRDARLPGMCLPTSVCAHVCAWMHVCACLEEEREGREGQMVLLYGPACKLPSTHLKGCPCSGPPHQVRGWPPQLHYAPSGGADPRGPSSRPQRHCQRASRRPRRRRDGCDGCDGCDAPHAMLQLPWTPCPTAGSPLGHAWKRRQ